MENSWKQSKRGEVTHVLLPTLLSASTSTCFRYRVELDKPWVYSSTAAFTAAGEYQPRDPQALLPGKELVSNGCPAGHSIPSFRNTGSPWGHDGEQVPGPPMQVGLKHTCGRDHL